MAKKPSHIHKLKMHKYKNGTTIYFCTLPDCYHKVEAHLTIGKIALCNMCFKEFVMTERTAKLLRPHCPNCGKVRVKMDDGKVTYLRKINKSISNTIAVDKLNELRARLDNVIRNEAEEDI